LVFCNPEEISREFFCRFFPLAPTDLSLFSDFSQDFPDMESDLIFFFFLNIYMLFSYTSTTFLREQARPPQPDDLSA
jgi:hypothetical protein